MAKIMYVACYWGASPRIKECKVDRSTNLHVFIDGLRRAKSSGYNNYFYTKEDAKNFLLNQANNQIEGFEKSLANARANHGLIKSM